MYISQEKSFFIGTVGNIFDVKGVVDCFFLGLIVFMGCSLTCIYASFLKNIIFHIIYLYSTPLYPFSYKHADDFLAPPSEISNGLWLASWPSVLWLAKPALVCI